MLVYLITNVINGKRYIGQTSKSLEYRWNLHKYNSSCPAMKAAIRKYGHENFSTEVLFDDLDKSLADELEIEHIQKFCTRAPNGYNLTEGGEGIINPSKEIREARSIGNLGNKNAFGAYRSPEYRKKLSDVQKGRKLTPEHRQKLSDAAKQKPPISEETRFKLREASLSFGNRPPKTTSQSAKKSLHTRYHTNRSIVNPNCELCSSKK